MPAPAYNIYPDCSAAAPPFPPADQHLPDAPMPGVRPASLLLVAATALCALPVSAEEAAKGVSTGEGFVGENPENETKADIQTRQVMMGDKVAEVRSMPPAPPRSASGPLRQRFSFHGARLHTLCYWCNHCRRRRGCGTRTPACTTSTSTDSECLPLAVQLAAPRPETNRFCVRA